MSVTVSEPRYYEISDFARTFGVSAATVDKWCRMGRLNPLRTVGGTRLFTETDREEMQLLRDERATGHRPIPCEAA